MNLSKKLDQRFWNRWVKAGAVMPGHAIVTNVGKGKRLVRFIVPMSVRDSVKILAECGLRPATMEELNSFAGIGGTKMSNPIRNQETKWDTSYRFLFTRI